MQYLITFLEGIISFISPCMLPMLPIYISYFAGKADKKQHNGNMKPAGESDVTHILRTPVTAQNVGCLGVVKRLNQSGHAGQFRQFLRKFSGMCRHDNQHRQQ